MRKFLSWLGGLSLVLMGGASVALAQAPEYEGSTFDTLQVVADDALLFFGVIVVAAVLVTGFFLGRKWLRSVG